MKNPGIIRCLQLLAVLFVLAATGCSTTYRLDRARDVRDCFTASVGLGVGVKAKAGPFQPTLLKGRDSFGLRAGEWFENGSELSYNTEWGVLWPVTGEYNYNVVVLGSGWECFVPEPPQVAFLRNKDIDTRSPFPCMAFGKAPSWTQLEAAVGLGPMLRLGCNPGEMLDLLLGLVGIDIYGDDVSAIEKAERDARQNEIDRLIRERHMLYEIRKNRRKKNQHGGP